jgi:hypothetical protein
VLHRALLALHFFGSPGVRRVVWLL